MKGMGRTIAAALLGASCAALVAVLLRAAQRRQATERQLTALDATVETLQARIAKLSRAAVPAQEIASIAASAQSHGAPTRPEPKPETLAVITAAATAFLGKAARIRSARLMPPAAENVSSWSQQGRVIVQTSHNLRSRE